MISSGATFFKWNLSHHIPITSMLRFPQFALSFPGSGAPRSHTLSMPAWSTPPWWVKYVNIQYLSSKIAVLLCSTSWPDIRGKKKLFYENKESLRISYQNLWFLRIIKNFIRVFCDLFKWSPQKTCNFKGGGKWHLYVTLIQKNPALGPRVYPLQQDISMSRIILCRGLYG